MLSKHWLASQPAAPSHSMSSPPLVTPSVFSSLGSLGTGFLVLS